MGHVRQLDAAGREVLRGTWADDRGPGDRPLTIDMGSAICEVYRPLKLGVGFGSTKVRGYHPLLAPTADTGQALHSRLRGGSALTAREPPVSWPRPSPGFEPLGRVASSPCGRLAASTPGRWSPPAAGPECVSRSPPAWTRRSNGRSRPFPKRRGCRSRTSRVQVPAGWTSSCQPVPPPVGCGALCSLRLDRAPAPPPMTPWPSPRAGPGRGCSPPPSARSAPPTDRPLPHGSRQLATGLSVPRFPC